MEADVHRVLTDFDSHGIWSRGSNSSFIALIPKMESPQGLNDYKPISLVGCIYKIVAKILANQLKKVLPSLIGEEQSAFLEGRSMLDSILVANELVHDAKNKDKETMVFKVDFEKAYDSEGN